MSYDPNRTADIYAEVESAPAKEKQKLPASDRERLASVRQRTIALSKKSNAASGFITHHESYYEDFAGVETSHWDFDHLTFLLNFLREPKFQSLWFRLENGHYDAIAANWKLVRATPMKLSQGEPPHFATLVKLKSALAARIKELSIDAILLAEWMSVAHSIADDQIFYRLSFEDQMNTFRQGESL
jgi:hypothetical protein